MNSKKTKLITLKELAELNKYPFQDSEIKNTKNFNKKLSFEKFYIHDSKIIVKLPSVKLKIGSGMTFTKSGEVLSDFALRLATEKFIKEFPDSENLSAIIPNTTIKGNVLYLGAQKNYYHWMMNWMSRVSILELSNNIQYYDQILIGENPASYQLECIKSVNSIKNKSIIFAKPSHIYELTDCLWTSIYKDPLHSPSHSNWLKSVFLEEKSNFQTKKIYISRADTPSRRSVENEEEVIQLLRIYGFEKVVLSDLSVKEQAALFSSVSAVVAPHGAGLTNLIFCSPGVKVCELQSRSKYTSMYHSIGKMMSSSKYDIVRCDPVGEKAINLQNLIVDIASLKKVIENY
jgi:hypothetical protein